MTIYVLICHKLLEFVVSNGDFMNSERKLREERA